MSDGAKQEVVVKPTGSVVGEVCAGASDGAFQYADIGKLTPADLPKLEAAVRRLQEELKEPES